MVRHILFWKFSDRVNDDNRNEVLSMLRASVNGLQGNIPGLLSCEIGEAVEGSDCDFVFYAELESLEAVRAFQNHPLHLAHKERSAPYVQARFAADYEV